MLPKHDDILKAMDLIVEVFEINNITPSAGFSACLNTIAKVLMVEGVPNDKVDSVMKTISDCFESIGANFEIKRCPYEK